MSLNNPNTKKQAKRNSQWFMGKALTEARKAFQKAEAPIGAVIVKDGKIISRGHNKKELHQDPTFHAEILAIQKACRKVKSWRLEDCDMYVTLEPCTMCAGAIVHSRIKRLFIGAFDPKAGAFGSVIDVSRISNLNHKVEVHYGILESECSEILKVFFRNLRQKNKLDSDLK